MRQAPSSLSASRIARILVVLGGGTWLCASVAAGEPGRSVLDVRGGEGWITIRASAAPLADVLERLSAFLGMKVVYGGEPPRQLVNLEVKRQTPADAVLALLASQGVDFALRTGASGAVPESLFISGVVGALPLADKPAGSPAAGALEQANPEPAEEEVDPPENLITSPAVDPIAVAETEAEEEAPSAEAAPATSPTPAPQAGPSPPE